MMKRRIRWAEFGLTVKRKSLTPLSLRDLEGLSHLLSSMPLRAIPVALTQKGDPILVTIDRQGEPDLIVEWRHDGPWNIILTSTPRAYLAGERCPPRRHGLPVRMLELRTQSPRHLVDRFVYDLGMLHDEWNPTDTSPRERRDLLAVRIQESAESERAFIASGNDLRFKTVWLAIAERYRSLSNIGGFMTAVQNALGTCTVSSRWGCRSDEPHERWNRCLDFMRTHRDFVVGKGDALDVATYEAMMDVISADL